jgi:hypothetical protein
MVGTRHSRQEVDVGLAPEEVGVVGGGSAADGGGSGSVLDGGGAEGDGSEGGEPEGDDGFVLGGDGCSGRCVPGGVDGSVGPECVGVGSGLGVGSGFGASGRQVTCTWLPPGWNVMVPSPWEFDRREMWTRTVTLWPAARRPDEG